jgi:hypothetical protein
VILTDDESDEESTDDEAEGAPSTIETVRVSSGATSGRVKPPDASGAWYDIEEGRFVEEPVSSLPSCEQESTTSAIAQDQLQIVSASQSLEVQSKQGAIAHFTRALSVGVRSHCLSQSSHTGDGEWTENKVVELEREVDLGSENCSSRLEESAYGSRQGTPTPALEEWEPQEEELAEEVEVIEPLQQDDESPKQMEDLVSVEGTDDADEREATGSLPATQLGIIESSLQSHNREPTMGRRGEKREHQDAQTDISTDTQYSFDSDDACNTDDEDPRPAKWRKLRSAPAVAAPTHSRQPETRASPSTTTDFAAGDLVAQADHDGIPTDIHIEKDNASRTSRSSSGEPVPVAEYDEWPFQGFLKRATIGDEITYPRTSEDPSQAINPEALEICSSRATVSKPPARRKAATHSKVHQTSLQSRKKNAKWTEAEEATVIRMKDRGCSWEEINKELPYRSIGTIQVRYYTKLRGPC